ncbi:vacuolar sorting protein, putative [Ichthyophthirius multifiliis]|uniref:Vacuolar protein sorting-associated protein 11 homolog n=1 Tax=Ichthyophthirius multifiliis TaxID=5932 RepID=G0R3B8_ICHMU|nr:vacuolar sorting protein, putative [Ichthyophthirius multifiliis]EGR28037.1 vacuolar sorting protein, putative [Ichthyophthirius multifiliis]|eukprot:XP_004027382.1 vacuolar sorting protein, putative [Ichthyophthirius multifiliis]
MQQKTQKGEQQYKKFQFFQETEIEDKSKNHTEHSLSDVDISKGEYINHRLYFCSKKLSTIFIHEKDQIIYSFQPFQHQLYSIYKSPQYLLAYGSESQEHTYSYLKIYSPEQQQENPLKLIRTIQIGKNLQSKDCMSFTLTQDLTAIALGFKDGNVILLKSIDLASQAYKEFNIKPSNQRIKQLFLSKIDQCIHLFVCTDENIQCWQDCTKKHILYQPGGQLFDLTAKGTLIGCCNADNSTIMEFDIKEKLRQFAFEDENWLKNVNQKIYINFQNINLINFFLKKKQEIRCFKNNYLIILSFQKEDFQITIFDLLNEYIAFKQNYKSIQQLIISQNFIHLMHMTQKGEKKLIKLVERENAYKIEYFFKRSFYEVAWKFAKNQNSDLSLLAEISRLHGDNLYGKGEFELAIKKYIETVGYIEPSYIIRKFLDVAHIDYLIQYLEEVHSKKQADKHHTALLLNCFVKQKDIKKLDKFLNEQNYDSQLFDIETAIKVCRESKNLDLALRLAEQNKQSEQYLDILLEEEEMENNGKSASKAIDYIRTKVDLQDKVKFILEFGQKLMKNNPKECLELIQKIVLLSHIATQINSKRSQSNQAELKITDMKSKQVLQYFSLSEQDAEQISQTTFRKPDEFFHIFISGKDDQLEAYLKFLLEEVDNLQNDKAVFHRFFEFYLEIYQDDSKNEMYLLIFFQQQNYYYIYNRKIGPLTLKENVKFQIIDVLKNPKYEKKYDKNHLLVLFKMYNFAPGIIHLCQQMQLKEELLNFYITNNESDKIIELCSTESQETNLWVQVMYIVFKIILKIQKKALKYFTKQTKNEKVQADNEKKLNTILLNIQNLNTLSPLLVLNILAKNKNVKFKSIKDYFIKKLEEDQKQIQKDQEIVNKNTNQAKEHREEYQKIKTQAKAIFLNKKNKKNRYLFITFQVFNIKKCSDCETDLSNPRVHFMCGHSYHEGCLHNERKEKECEKCSLEFKSVLERKEQFDSQINDSKQFLESLNQSNNKFDIISGYLGKGLFSRNMLNK